MLQTYIFTANVVIFFLKQYIKKIMENQKSNSNLKAVIAILAVLLIEFGLYFLK